MTVPNRVNSKFQKANFCSLFMIIKLIASHNVHCKPKICLNPRYYSKFQNHELLWQEQCDIFKKFVNKQLQQKNLTLGEFYLISGTSKNPIDFLSFSSLCMNFSTFCRASLPLHSSMEIWVQLTLGCSQIKAAMFKSKYNADM